MAKLHDFKITGRTAASADGTATGLIATQTVEYHDDGSLRFTINGVRHLIQPSASLNALFKVLFTGTGGVATGKKFHGNP